MMPSQIAELTPQQQLTMLQAQTILEEDTGSVSFNSMDDYHNWLASRRGTENG